MPQETLLAFWGTSTLELPFSLSLLGLDAWLFTRNLHPIQSSSAVPATHQCVLGIARGFSPIQEAQASHSTSDIRQGKLSDLTACFESSLLTLWWILGKLTNVSLTFLTCKMVMITERSLWSCKDEMRKQNEVCQGLARESCPVTGVTAVTSESEGCGRGRGEGWQ